MTKTAWENFIGIFDHCHCVEINGKISYSYIGSTIDGEIDYIEFIDLDLFIYKKDIVKVELVNYYKDQIIVNLKKKKNKGVFSITITPLYKKELKLK